jgi:hypothetical protein
VRLAVFILRKIDFSATRKPNKEKKWSGAARDAAMVLHAPQLANLNPG